MTSRINEDRGGEERFPPPLWMINFINPTYRCTKRPLLDAADILTISKAPRITPHKRLEYKSPLYWGGSSTNSVVHFRSWGKGNAGGKGQRGFQRWRAGSERPVWGAGFLSKGEGANAKNFNHFTHFKPNHIKLKTSYKLYPTPFSKYAKNTRVQCPRFT